MNKNNKTLPSDLENVDDHGGEVTEEEDHHHTHQHAGQAQLPSLGPPTVKIRHSNISYFCYIFIIFIHILLR